jgi:microcystin-dependent protein
MSNCSNCYNGCTEIVSDRCVKYTGIDVPVLGIQTGDSLSFVEQALITFLTSTLDGTGIKPVIDPLIICNLVNKYLPTCGDITAVDLFNALIKSACDLQEQIDVIVADIVLINNQLDVIEADYNVKCLPVVTPSITPSSGTHAVLQATIDTLCAFILIVETNYVTIEQLPILIQAYLNSLSTGLISNKMVPFSVLPYFGDLSYFDTSGAGIIGSSWEKIYLCNGNNSTPDLRGRALTGAINGVPGPPMSAAVDPAIPGSGNPNYSLYDTAGANQITLGPTQFPSHTHTGLISTIPNHTHYTVVAASGTSTNDNSLYNGTFAGRNDLGLTSRAYNADGDPFDYELTTSAGTIDAGITSEAGEHTHTITIGNTGGGLPHANIQPVVACYYIQYRPY